MRYNAQNLTNSGNLELKNFISSYKMLQSSIAGVAWLSLVRAVGCLVNSLNERTLLGIFN